MKVAERVEALKKKGIHSIANDARFWDGWRTYGDAWALKYLASVERKSA